MLLKTKGYLASFFALFYLCFIAVTAVILVLFVFVVDFKKLHRRTADLLKPCVTVAED